MLQHRRAVASAMAREDELVALAQAEAALLQLPLHLAQDAIGFAQLDYQSRC